MSQKPPPPSMHSASTMDHKEKSGSDPLSNKGTEVEKQRKKMSLNYALDENGQPIGLPLDLFLFSNDGIHPTEEEGETPEDIIRVAKKYRMPDTKVAPTFEFSQLPGQVPLSDDFHLISNRERNGPNDDGLEDEDLTHADGVVRKKTQAARRKSIIYDNIWIYKGEFLFPYRTYRPKVQVAYKGGAGQVPQAVVCERLHRLYKRTDINIVLQLLGIENSDLVPPPNYAESNERFYQEMTFRNRKLESFQEEHLIHAHLHAPKDGNSSVSYPSSEDSKPSSSNSAENTIPTHDKNKPQGNIKDHIDDHHLDDIHPFIRSKPPFGHMFPVNCFDNLEFDIRPPQEWMSLGNDVKERKFYPLPGKAFMPLPGNEAKKKSAAFSETVRDHLLNDTPRLNKMYHWLLNERYERTVKMLGLDIDQIKNHPTDVDMGLLARVATTVPALHKASDTHLVERITQEIKAAHESELENNEGLDFTGAASLLSTIADPLHNDGDKDSSSESPDSPMLPNMMEYVDSKGVIVRVKNVIEKKRKDKRMGSQEEEDEQDTNVEADDTEALETIPELEDDEEEDEEEEEEEEEQSDDDADSLFYDEDESNTWSGLPSKAILNGDYGHVRPVSPNIDPFVDGHDKYVMEFDKMKKVHVYDWKWADVAIFDYNERTQRFYVRTIYAPIVHAWVDKIYLCFDGEDPHHHGKRIRDAVVRRIESENIMRFNLYIDCLPVDGIPPISEETMKVILAKTLSAPKLQYNEASLEKVKLELELEHKRTLAKGKFIQVIERHHHLYKPWVSIPEHDKTFCYMAPQDATAQWKKILAISADIPKQVFAYKKLRIMKLSVRFGEKEPRDTLNKIQEICIEARKKHLILTDLETMSIDEWEERQKENIAEVRKFLTEEWCQLVVNVLIEHLSKIPHSWYNLKETNFDIFIMSKLNNYLTLIKLMMEDTIRSMVVESLQRFIDRLKEVTREIDYKRKFTWDKNNLMKSLYPTPKGITPLWTIDIVMEAESARYNHLLGDIVTVIKTLFTEVVECVKDLPTLLPRLMPQMQFATRPYLLCPEPGEEEMLKLNSEMQKYLKVTLLPVDTYVLQYNKYLSIWNTEEFLKEWNVKRHSADEVAAEVELHRSQETIYEKEIPKTINITGFTVNIENLREELLRKKKSMYTTILDAHAQKLKRVIQRVNEEYEEMERKVNIRSNIIEEVKDLKFYVAALPEQIEKLQEITMGVIKDYEVFDRFLYTIPDEDVSAKWMTAIYSGTVMRLGKAAVNWLIDDYDKSLDLQQTQLHELSLEIEALANSVMELSEFNDLEQAPEVCEQMESLKEQEKLLEEKLAVLNRRQKIFGADLLFQDELENILAGIEPYHDLWTTCVEWLKVIDSVNNGTLEEVDIDALVSVINDGVDKVSDCAEHFGEAGLDKVEAIAVKVKEKMDEFLPLAPLMRALRNDGLRPRHWTQISELTGIPVVTKTENFKTLLDQGIATFAQEIVDIGELATNELEIEVALEKMQEKIAEFSVLFTLDPVSKQHLISWSNESKEMVEQFVKETEELKDNEFNEPFEEELAKWEKKITMAKNSMELWLKLQTDWVSEIEPWFRAADVKTRLPAEFKLFEKMQRIWKRLIRNIKSKPVLIELASDSTVAASLAQFDELTTTMKKALEEYQRPKNSDDSDD